MGTQPINDQFNFKYALKQYPTEGNLVYEYNPFYNYRLDHTMIYYKQRLWELEKFAEELNLDYDKDTGTIDWKGVIPETEAQPVVYQKGQLVDFETDQLHFSLNNPVNILPQWSYDGSTNLIINDGKNSPRLINSRFSPLGRNKYKVCNRKGNNDSNIYDQGDQFDIDTSLYKKTNTIPELRFLGVSFGGNLTVGNYHFYFRYVDEDGNESDFFAESGLVSIFIGNSADSIHSGFRDTQAHKQVRFFLTNTDAGYDKVHIYYTKATSDLDQNAVTEAKKILQEFKLNANGNTAIVISGFEETQDVALSDINVFYQIYGSAATQEQAQNMLFLGNVDRPKIQYEDLADCALRFLPVLNTQEEYGVNQLGIDYNAKVDNTYYDPSYIYNKVGYWDDEIYRLGIVFIQSDNTLTDVFNIRGGKLSEGQEYTHFSLFESGNRSYITYDEQTYEIMKNDGNSNTSLENAKGVIHINCPNPSTVIGIDIKVDKKVVDYLQDTLHIKGFIIVRQRRIPTTLCQAYTIGIDKESHTPVLPVSSVTDYDLKGKKYITESFLANTTDDKKLLVHDFKKRINTLEDQQVVVQGAICPEYDVNFPYLNNLFAASELVCRDCSGDAQLLVNTGQQDIHFYPKSLTFQKADTYSNIKVIGVEDNTKLVAINDQMFSARAGEAEEAFRYAYIGQKKLDTDSTNLLRGSYGPFLGITGYEKVGHLIDIKIPGYSPSLMRDYFMIRYEDKAPYYAISDRLTFDKLINEGVSNQKDKDSPTYLKIENPLYRGDCYICQFTHRVNRNFQDPSAPTNDEIVDPKCWQNHYAVADGVVKTENFDKINLGDVNAVKLGMYVTLVVRSTMNLNIRAIDESITDETALFGHPRGFYPYHPMTTAGVYKTPESLCYNKGFENSVSSKFFFEVPDVPWIKNEFSNRIAYSNIQVQDAFQNGWRTFMGTHYRDYPKTYGSITRLVELGGNLLCVFEHGVALIPVNERALAGEGSGGTVYVNTSNVLPENPKIISDIYGSQWRESIVKTPAGVYGVDTVSKKIWFTNGSAFKCISDFSVQEFLNNNISLTERELDPIIGIRNVKSHYNAFKQDVMFTFYDNLYGFSEKVWNLCWNERLSKWITFYSWVPSYSENIFNQFFSFDRNTSKWIAKLGISNSKNDFSDGIVLENNIISGDGWSTNVSTTRQELTRLDTEVTYSLERDIFGNYQYFTLNNNVLSLKPGKYSELKVDIFEVDSNGKFKKDDRGRRIRKKDPINEDRIVILLNIKASVNKTVPENNITAADGYLQGFYNSVSVDAGYYQSTVAVILKENQQYLTTDFWKHGQGGIIDIADDIHPTYWYGKQHPFEFEFIVAENPDRHKIFDSLQIISNKAEPESFHYEIIGECYDFAKDKKNMYIRQEAVKELYQYNGAGIEFNPDYKSLDNIPRSVKTGRNLSDEEIKGYQEEFYDKSTIFPQWYYRKDTINEIEDYYHSWKENSKHFCQLAGAEIVRYDSLNEYRIWNHAKAVDVRGDQGILRGNMQYKEDKWYVQINPINLVQKNEEPEDWNKTFKLSDTKYEKQVPAELNLFNKLDVLEGTSSRPGNNDTISLPRDWERNIVKWNNYECRNHQVKLKDKFIKIRIRYSGKDLAIISAINTLYTISYG